MYRKSAKNIGRGAPSTSLRSNNELVIGVKEGPNARHGELQREQRANTTVVASGASPHFDDFRVPKPR
eukprot:COSAG02_NODE_28_length_51367_cov_70.053932_8_plen_68_part_00